MVHPLNINLFNWKPSRNKIGVFLAFPVLIVVFVFAYHKVSLQMQSRHRAVHIIDDVDIHGRWQNFTSDTFRLYAYSAIYDDRPSLLLPPVVRIIAISDKFENRKELTLFCILNHDTNGIKVMLMEENPRPVGGGWPLNRRNAREYVYTCPTVKGLIPNSIRITALRKDNSNQFLSVILPNKPQQQQDFGVCVQVAFGTLEPHRIIEWLEVLKILGVSLVGVYNLSISETGLKVLKHYANEGFVDLRNTNEIYEHDDRHYLLQGSPVINDCMYRHMYEFRRIIVIDFDEIIMPRKHKNLWELVSYLDQITTEKNTSNANYAFRNNYFFLDLPPDEAISSNFTMLRYRKKVKVSPEGYSVKSIINPQACTHMHNHYCWGLTAKYSHHESIFSVDPEIALNQHYKKCHFSENECRTMMQNATQDDIMMRLRDVITKRVGAKIKTIF